MAMWGIPPAAAVAGPPPPGYAPPPEGGTGAPTVGVRKMPGAVVGPAVVMAGAGAEVMNAGLAGVLGPTGEPAAVGPGAGGGRAPEVGCAGAVL